MTTDHTPPADQAMHDRIRRVLAQSDGFDPDQLEPHDYQIQAAAVLAVLPPPVSRADVLREAAGALDAGMERFFTEWPDEPRNSPCALGKKDAADELRRMADEAQPGTEAPADVEHCVHDRAVHQRHHHTPVDGCPWCAASVEARP